MALDMTLGSGEYNLMALPVTQQVEPQVVELNSVTYPIPH